MTPQIEQYVFGSLVVDGEHYKNDVLMLGGAVFGEWWRTQGHLCQESDLEEVFAARPKALVVGLGSSSLMRLSHDVERRCKKLGIEFHGAPTAEAVAIYNRLVDEGKDVAGAFHLTC